MGPLTDKIGRKYVLMISGIYFGLSFLILGSTHEIELIYLSRFLQGCGVGTVNTVVPMYVGEISTVAYRGLLGSLMQLFTTCTISLSITKYNFVTILFQLVFFLFTVLDPLLIMLSSSSSAFQSPLFSFCYLC